MIPRRGGKDNWSYHPVFAKEDLQLAPFFVVVLCAPPIVVSVMAAVTVTPVTENGRCQVFIIGHRLHLPWGLLVLATTLPCWSVA